MIIEIPGINGLGKTKGCEKASEIISEYLNLKSEKIKLDNSNIEEQELKIYNEIKEILDSAKQNKLILLGGDHSISYPIGKAFLEKYGLKNSALLIFDAHYDLMKPMKNPTHEEWLRALIENKKFKNILLIGIREKSENIDKREKEFAEKSKIKITSSQDFDKKEKEILEFCKNKNLYISLDLDVLDSKIFSSTGYPEKQGLSQKQLIDILKKLKNNFLILDIVEYNPELDKSRKGLKIIKKILKALSEV